MPIVRFWHKADVGGGNRIESCNRYHGLILILFISQILTNKSSDLCDSKYYRKHPYKFDMEQIELIAAEILSKIG